MFCLVFFSFPKYLSCFQGEARKKNHSCTCSRIYCSNCINTCTIKHTYSCLLYSRYLPREVDPLVYNMSHEDPGDVSYSEIGGLSEQIRELREVSQSEQCYQIVGCVLSQVFQCINVLLMFVLNYCETGC